MPALKLCLTPPPKQSRRDDLEDFAQFLLTLTDCRGPWDELTHKRKRQFRTAAHQLIYNPPECWLKARKELQA